MGSLLTKQQLHRRARYQRSNHGAKHYQHDAPLRRRRHHPSYRFDPGNQHRDQCPRRIRPPAGRRHQRRLKDGRERDSRLGLCLRPRLRLGRHRLVIPSLRQAADEFRAMGRHAWRAHRQEQTFLFRRLRAGVLYCRQRTSDKYAQLERLRHSTGPSTEYYRLPRPPWPRRE